MGKVKSWVMDCEEQFYDIVADAVKQAEHVTEAYTVANANKDLVVHWGPGEIEECVDEMWHDFWSKYNG